MTTKNKEYLTELIHGQIQLYCKFTGLSADRVLATRLARAIDDEFNIFGREELAKNLISDVLFSSKNLIDKEFENRLLTYLKTY